jgi:tetratricopeptide (TPR) repeat protein
MITEPAISELAIEAEIPSISIPPIEIGSDQIEKARNILSQGDISEALNQYAGIIQSGQFLEFVVKDLQEASTRYPKDLDLWQNLGDACVRLNRLSEALQAYLKAEELLR